MIRGEVWWADFGHPFGFEPGYRRPVIVMQADTFNRSRIETVLVVPMTTNTELAAAPGNVLCRPKDTGLDKPSVANVSQLSVLDRRCLVEKAGAVTTRVMTQVEDGVRLVLGL
ncbi:MAG TPA: type II toxin-antitoxin system PemK/MazF family toxin [Vicinamibacteria bacterium]|jgi:mRNA interferase MazF